MIQHDLLLEVLGGERKNVYSDIADTLDCNLEIGEV